MTEDEAIELLLRKSKEDLAPGSWKEASKVVSKLAYLPAAIHQAAAYIGFTNITISQFLENYKEQEFDILENAPEYTSKIWEYQENENRNPLSSFIICEMALRKVGPDEEDRKKVENFLAVCAFLDPSSITEDLFINSQKCTEYRPEWIDLSTSLRSDRGLNGYRYEVSGGANSKGQVPSGGQGLPATSGNSTRYESLVNKLREFDLLENASSDTDCKRFSLHPSIRDWLQLRMRRTEQQDRVREAITLLTIYLEYTEVSAAPLRMKQDILAHMDTCVSNSRLLLKHEGLGSVLLAFSTTSFGIFYCQQGRYWDAASLFTSLLKDAEECLGYLDELTLNTRENLGNVYYHQGRYKEAEVELAQVLTTREKQLGKEHLDTLRGAHFLANVYHYGHRDKAEALYEWVFTCRCKRLGPEHPDTLSAANSLAIIYRLTKRYSESIKMYQGVLGMRMKQLGDQHPETMTSAQGLAIVLRLQRSWELAEKWQRWTLERRERQLGNDHPDTFMTIDNLASVCRDIGCYDEAINLYKRALRGRIKLLGLQSPSTLVTFNGLAVMFRQQQQYEAAQTLHKFVLLTRKKQLGPNHPKTLLTRDQLAEVYQLRGLFKEQGAVLTQALACRREVLGADNPDTLRTAELLKKACHVSRIYP
jgi:tetratricopeptide (TPR) repeat protein